MTTNTTTTNNKKNKKKRSSSTTTSLKKKKMKMENVSHKNFTVWCDHQYHGCQRDLFQLTGLSKNTISLLYNQAHKPNPKTVYLISKFTGLTFQEIYEPWDHLRLSQ